MGRQTRAGTERRGRSGEPRNPDPDRDRDRDPDPDPTATPTPLNTRSG